MAKKIKILRIAFVLDDGLDKPDGVQQSILTFGAWLEKKGHIITYLVGETNRADIKNAMSLSRNFSVSFNSNKLTMPFFSSKKVIKKIITDGNFDIIHVQVPYSPFMGARIVKIANRKTAIIGTFHILPAYMFAKYGTKFLGLYLKNNLSKFDKNLAVSKPAAKFAKWSFGIDCDVLPNPVNFKFKATPKKRSDITNIVFLGRLVERKGCDKLLQAIVKLKSQYPSLKFIVNIYGDGPQKRKLIEYCRKNKINDHVKFNGFVEEKDKIYKLSQADIAIFPSIGGESFGIVLIEAISSGVNAVLAANNPGYSATLEDSQECLFDPHDSKNMAELIYKYSTNNTAVEKLHAKQLNLAKKYNVNTVGTKLLDVYRNSIDNKSSL